MYDVCVKDLFAAYMKNDYFLSLPFALLHLTDTSVLAKALSQVAG